jgi:hypothetical protein
MRRQRPKVARTLHPVMDGDAVNRALTADQQMSFPERFPHLTAKAAEV